MPARYPHCLGTTCRLLLILTLAVWGDPASAQNQDPSFNYLIGRGSADITGPAVGVPMFGFVRADQIAEGIHLRQRARAFVIAEPDSERRLAFVSVDMGSVTHEMLRAVLEQLASRYGKLYALHNVIISATHTHAGPGGYWHYGTDTPLGGPFYREFFDAIVEGITASIVAAHEDLEPGRILIAAGLLQGAGVQRSAVAYQNNPAQERARYDSDTDRQMTLLKFVDASGPIGTLNWFGVHPTSMTYYNRLISGDNKGYASYAFEQRMGARYQGPQEFVAAFAQSNCGDVTPNLNLNNTGPGKDDFQSTQVIGERQLAKAVALFNGATEQLQGPIDYRHAYVDFSRLMVGDEYTHAGQQTTCPSAYGYAFAAGSTEDGGGHPLFKEGMKERIPLIDNLIKAVAPKGAPSDALRACQAPKVILYAPGALDPPAQAQVQPLSIARIGQLVIVAGPAEFTTMSGRRIRETVAQKLGNSVRHVVIAGYANGYAGYVTTREEYETQQYEGGHTLYGPWTQAGYQQGFARLAEALASAAVGDSSTIAPRDIRDEVESTPLGTDHDEAPPESASFGAVVQDAAETYHPGDEVVVAFWTGHPQNGYDREHLYLTVQHKDGDAWVSVATDADWETRCRWTQPGPKRGAAPGAASRPTAAKPSINPLGLVPRPTSPAAHQVTIQWAVPLTTQLGIYRIAHHGSYKKTDGSVERFTGCSRQFRVEPAAEP